MNSKRSYAAIGGIVVVALAIRIAVLLFSHSYEIPSQRDHWSFAFEAGRIARSLATGQGFSSPMPEPSGPTALLPLGYPLILSGIFRLFGVYTTQSAVAAYVLNCIVSALTCVALYLLGDRLFGRATGLLAAAWMALDPPSIWHSVNTIWDTTLLAFAVVALITWLCDMPARPGTSLLFRTGLLMGFVALYNPAPLSFYPAVALLLWLRMRAQGSRGYREIAILATSCLLVLLPWMVRNAIQLGSFTPRTGAGINLRLGNSDGAWLLRTGESDLSVYPSNSPREAQLFYRMGELNYDRYCAGIGWDFIRSHPARFAALTAMRMRNWWLGQSSEWSGTLRIGFHLSALKQISWLLPLPFFVLGCIAAWRNRVPAGLVVALLLLYPIPYYFMVVEERYHFPVEPFLLLVGSYGLIQVGEWFKARWNQRES